MSGEFSINKIFATGLAVLLVSMFSLSFVAHAQETAPTSSGSLLNGTEEQLDGMEVETPQSVPSGFGLWLRDLRENISVALTFDPVKKSEKLLLFAEERMKIAQKIMEESNNPNAQAKAEKMIEQAQKHIAKIEEQKEKWIDKKDERTERLKNNFATHELRKDAILGKIEEKLSDEAREKFDEIRDRMLEQARVFVGTWDDGELSEKTQEHIIDVRERIEASSATVKQYREQKKELLGNEELSEEQMKEQMRVLWEQRKNQMEQIRLQFKQEQENWRQNFDQSRKPEAKTEEIKEAQSLLQKKNELFREYSEKLAELRREKMSDAEFQKKVQELKVELEKKLSELRAKEAELNSAFMKARQKAEDLKLNSELRAGELEREIEND